MEDPRAHVERIESAGVRTVTPVASGAMVWRAWGEGPPLVLLHGASGSWTHWIRNVLQLARHHRVLVPDMPGYGESDAPPEPHTADGLAALVAAGIDAMLPPPAAFDLAGFSFGAIIGGLVAAALAGRVRTLVLLGPGGPGLTPAPPRARASSRGRSRCRTSCFAHSRPSGPTWAESGAGATRSPATTWTRAGRCWR